MNFKKVDKGPQCQIDNFNYYWQRNFQNNLQSGVHNFFWLSIQYLNLNIWRGPPYIHSLCNTSLSLSFSLSLHCVCKQRIGTSRLDLRIIYRIYRFIGYILEQQELHYQHLHHPIQRVYCSHHTLAFRLGVLFCGYPRRYMSLALCMRTLKRTIFIHSQLLARKCLTLSTIYIVH